VVRKFDSFPGDANGRQRLRFHVSVRTFSHSLSKMLIEAMERENVNFGMEDQSFNSDALLLDLLDIHPHEMGNILRHLQPSKIPVIAAIASAQISLVDSSLDVSDFIVVPWSKGELSLRISQQIERNAVIERPGVIQVEDLVIDTGRYDVYLGGRPVFLTFKEYELLKLLASSPGHVYSRETLLEQVWGYQYFGGTRTVDVHVRRLRSKIEDADHSFIETVWNVGYRLRG